MKIVFAGYRSWALSAFIEVIETCNIKDYELVKNPEELGKVSNSVVIGAGWSWIIPQNVIERNKVIALMHPSDLPDYAGGSPIQHQIIDGLTETKACLFKVDNKLDSGPVFLKKRMSLEGNIEDIFDSLKDATRDLLVQFITKYPSISETPQRHSKDSIRKRLQPKDSMLTKKDIQGLSTKNLYNLMRCRENPYPNVYIEDEFGRLYFEKVRYEKNE